MPTRLYEDISETLPCVSAGIGSLSRLGSAPASVQNADGSVSEGVWHWWTSDSCPDPKTEAAKALAQLGRSNAGFDPLPDCPMPDVPGKTCIRRWYPERTLYRDGSFREQSWEFQPSAADKDVMGFRQRWDIYFTPDEAKLYAALQDDNYIRSLDPKAVMAIYYSLLNWKCVGKINPVLEPGPVSPQSLAGRYDTGSQFWLEFWESSLRDRLWMVRSDLRQVRLPDGRLETGLRPPTDLAAMRPHCTSTAGQFALYGAQALTALAAIPVPLQLAMALPDTLLGLRDLIRGLGISSQIQNALLGVPSAVDNALEAKASGETKSPTGVAGGAGGFPWWLVAGAAAIALS
jgi:hypothetical protein